MRREKREKRGCEHAMIAHDDEEEQGRKERRKE